MKSIFFDWSSWSVLRKVGNSYISILTILVPILGFVLLRVDFSAFPTDVASHLCATIPTGVSDVCTEEVVANNMSSANASKLRMSYVGLAIVGWTTIVFQIFCPSPIKTYLDDRAYATARLDVAHSGLGDWIDNLKTEKIWYKRSMDHSVDDLVSLQNTYNGSNPSIAARAGTSILKRAEWLEQNSNTLLRAYTFEFEKKNFSLILMRVAILIAYICGYILATLPSLGMLIQQFSDLPLIETIRQVIAQ